MVHAAVGDVAFRSGNFGDAEKEYRAALKIDTNSARGVYGMGRMLHMVSMNKRAKENFAKAHQLDPEDGEITRRWLETLPYAERLEQEKKTGGDPDNKANMSRYLTALADKKPWSMVNESKPMEIKMPLYGRNLTGVQDITRNGPKHIMKVIVFKSNSMIEQAQCCLMDTGAGGITIGRKLAERTGAVKIADTRIFGVGDQGPVESYVASVDKINIGPVEFHNCIVVVSSKNDVADDSGLIGADVFDKFLVTLDFHNQRMLLEPLAQKPQWRFRG